jgi:tRNA C32,U32 (ribose-2'-O)-methylase TrmJ
MVLGLWLYRHAVRLVALSHGVRLVSLQVVSTLSEALAGIKVSHTTSTSTSQQGHVLADDLVLLKKQQQEKLEEMKIMCRYHPPTGSQQGDPCSSI